MESANWQPLVVALGLGLLVGLQREWAKSEGAGIRTFALITVLGSVCGLLAARSGGWIVAAGLLPPLAAASLRAHCAERASRIWKRIK